jgi:hypothetical protein
MQIPDNRKAITDSGRHSPRLPVAGSGRVIAFCLLSLLLLTGALLTTGCDSMVPLKDDVIAEYEENYQAAELRASPVDFQVLNISSVVSWDDDNPVLTMLVLASNPNSYPRAFRSMRIEIFDEQGRQQGFKSWTTQRSPFIVGANAAVPLAFSFPGKSEWNTAKAYFSSTSTPNPKDIHQELQALSADPVKHGDNLGASITVQNMGTSTAIDVTVLAAGYDADGELVAWAEGLQHWRTLSAGSVSTFETDVFQGDISQVNTVRSFISAYRG